MSGDDIEDGKVRRIAALQGASSATLQSTLEAFAQRLVGRGLRVAGVIEIACEREGGGCKRLSVRDLVSGEEIPITQELGAGSTACNLDPAGLIAACGRIERAIDFGAEIVILSKFGKLEAARGGFSDAFRAALLADIPVVTAVPAALNDEWERFAPGLKTIEDATEIRRRILLVYELAEKEAALAGRRLPLNFVVVGGGPTGVELAGTLAEIAHKSLAHNFRSIDPARTRILLIEAGPDVLSSYPPDLRQSAVKQLQHLGVEVRTNSPVTDVRPGEVMIGDEGVPAALVLWAAGVSASPLGRALGAPLDRAGRVLVEPDLSLPGHPEVFVIGDLASMKDQQGRQLPGVAPVAMQQGRWIAHQIAADLAGRARRPFHYRDKGSLATIGRAAAIAQFGKIHISGFLAWLSWLFVHIFFLIGFRNRVVVMFQWAWSYLTYQRWARLITGGASAAASMQYVEQAALGEAECESPKPSVPIDANPTLPRVS